MPLPVIGSWIRSTPLRLPSAPTTSVSSDVSYTDAPCPRAEPAVVELKIARLVREVVDLYDYVAEEKKIKVMIEATEPCVANVDAIRIRQVFANLLDNAIKYTPEAGRVTMVKAVVEAHGGKVTVASRANEGATFAVKLPKDVSLA